MTLSSAGTFCEQDAQNLLKDGGCGDKEALPLIQFSWEMIVLC
jgi:hypothetical protein